MNAHLLPAGTNSSAIYAFLLLQWLLEAPRGIEELQACYQVHPWCGKKLSDDSIRLYLNTLRALGCQVERPSAKNHFRYRLATQSFTATNGMAKMKLLLKLFSALEATTHPTLILQRLTALNNLIQYTGVDAKNLDENRLLMLENKVLLKQIVHYTQKAETRFVSLQVAYQLPSYDKSTEKKAASIQHWNVIPLGLTQENGRIYWLVWEVVANQSPQWVQRMLSYDRLISVEPLQLPQAIQPYFEALTATYFESLPLYRFRIHCPLGSHFSGLGFHQETVTVAEESQRLLRSTQHALPLEIHYCYAVQTDFTFLLKQRLWGLVGTFTVIEAPEAFRVELQQETQQMLSLYEEQAVQEVEGGSSSPS